MAENWKEFSTTVTMPRWTTEARQQQAERIRALCPWTKSTGPRTEVGKAKSSRNAWKGGARSDMNYYSRLLRETGATLRDMFSSFCRIREYRPRRTFARKPHPSVMPMKGDLPDFPPDPELEQLSEEELMTMAGELLGGGGLLGPELFSSIGENALGPPTGCS